MGEPWVALIFFWKDLWVKKGWNGGTRGLLPHHFSFVVLVMFVSVDRCSIRTPSLVSDGLINGSDFKHRQPPKGVVATTIISVAEFRVPRSPDMDKNGRW